MASGEKLNNLPLLVKLYHHSFLPTVLILGLTFPGEAAQITGLESPNSFIGDPSGKEYFISNINGEPDARDNNGFITKLNAEGKVTDLKFIQGGVADMLLHAPKGMALVGPILYIADLDQLKAFDKTSGKLLIRPFPSRSHTQVIANRRGGRAGGMLYVSDQAANSIYRIDPSANHRIDLLIHDERLAGPAGIAIHPRTNHLIS